MTISKIKFVFRKAFLSLTGYYFYKIKYLPLGTNLFIDIKYRLNYKNVNVIFDVGANIGQTAEYFKSEAPKSRVYCFEPISSVFEKLKLNLAKYENVVFEKMALGEEKGIKTVKLFNEWSELNSLNDKLMNNAPDAREEIIEVDTLDNYCNENSVYQIDLLKIDTEGYEEKITRGASSMLADGKVALILCEVGFQKENMRNTSFSKLTEMLAEYDFYFFALYNISNHFLSTGNLFANALYVNKKILKSG